jgi:hypothetical protein
MKSIQELAKEVEQMQTIVNQTIRVRSLQKEYFRTRDFEILRQAKLAEGALDALLLDYSKDGSKKQNTAEAEHPRLF